MIDQASSRMTLGSDGCLLWVNRAVLTLCQLFPVYPGEQRKTGPVAELVGIEGGVVSGVINLESSGVEASDWRPRHDEQYHEA